MKQNKGAKSDNAAGSKPAKVEKSGKGAKAQRAEQGSAKKKAVVSKNLIMMLLGICIVLTAICYIPAINGTFVNWDDDDYAASNEAIRSFSNMKTILTVPVQGNYHPLTMLSLAVNYAISGPNTTSYHVFNILLHLANTVLVFFFIWKLSKGNVVMSFTAALLFGVHPMHVESVAWVSERKDVLYSFFYLLAAISYLKYVDKDSKSSYAISLFWFVLSLASKPAAIIFAGTLLTIDFFRARKFSVNLLLEKIPFLFFAGILTYLTLSAQKTVGATDTAGHFELVNRFFFMFYGYMMYIIKLVLPLNLCAFYPLPAVNETLPIEYFLSPIVFIATAALAWMTRKDYPIIAWGFGFYLVNLILVLQFKVIGSAIIADRYTYMPYIGLFVILGWFIDKMFANKQSTSIAVVSTLGVVLCAMSYVQAGTWKSSAALWDNAIAKVPSERAYVNRAVMLRREGNSDLALEYYNKAMRLNKVDHEAYCNRANIYFDKGMDSLALLDYQQALDLRPDFVPALDNRGALLARAGKSELALKDLNRALELNPNYKSAYANRAVTLFDLKRFDEAIRDFEKYITYYPNDVDNRNSIGVCYQMSNRHELAIKPFTECIAINPKGMFFLNRSYSYNATGKIDLARADAQEAVRRGMPVSPQYLQKLGLK